MSETTNTTEPDLEARVAELERRLSTAIEWAPESGNIAEEGQLESYRLESGDYDLAPLAEPTGTALDDLGSGAFHPTTWPQLALCLRRIAGELCILMDSHDNLEAWVEKQLGAVPMDGDRGYSDKELRTGALSPTHARTYDPEAQDRLLHRVAELEGQVFQVGKRLNDSIDWRPDPGNFAQAALWNRSRVPNGIRGEDKDEPTGCVLEDLSSGALRVTSWAQLLDCLQMLASNLLILVKDHDGDPSPFPPANQKDKDRVAAVLELAYGPPVVPA